MTTIPSDWTCRTRFVLIEHDGQTRETGECPTQSRWRSWPAKLRSGEIARPLSLAPVIRCRINYGMPCSTIRRAKEKPAQPIHQSHLFGYQANTCSASNVGVARALSKSRRPMRLGCTDPTRSGKMLGSDFLIRLAPSETGRPRGRRMLGLVGRPKTLASRL